jgi:hypothetical protein
MLKNFKLPYSLIGQIICYEKFALQYYLSKHEILTTIHLLNIKLYLNIWVNPTPHQHKEEMGIKWQCFVLTFRNDFDVNKYIMQLAKSQVGSRFKYAARLNPLLQHSHCHTEENHAWNLI